MKVLGASLDLVNKKVVNVLDPTSAQDAATKAYVDSLFGGLDWKASVRAATTANITLSGAQTVDGVSLIAGDRCLVKDQSTASGNGIYVVAAGAWTRATDADTSSEVTAGMTVVVEEGTANGDKAFVLTTNGAITVGTTSLTFTTLPSGSASGYQTVQEDGSGLTQRTIVNFGTGLTAVDNAGQTRTDVTVDTSYVVRKYAAAIGDGSTTNIVVTHSLNTQDVTVAVYLASGTFEEVLCDVEHTSVNTITCKFAVAPTSGQYRVVVHG
jgi:phage-related tail fiber protein